MTASPACERIASPAAFALFQSGQQISKPHSTKIAAMIEAFERGAVIRCRCSYELANGYDVRKVDPTERGG